MANRKRAIPQYGTVTLNGLDYYRTRVQDADGKLVALYARTPEELYDKELNALEQIDNDTFCRKSPTVAEYCEKWLLMQSVHVRATTMTDYTSKVRRHIIKELGDMRMADVTLDDIQLALVPVSKKSASVYKSVVVLYKSIFRAAKESRIIENNPTVYLTSKGGGVPQKEKEALTDEQAARLLDAIQGLPRCQSVPVHPQSLQTYHRNRPYSAAPLFFSKTLHNDQREAFPSAGLLSA